MTHQHGIFNIAVLNELNQIAPHVVVCVVLVVRTFTMITSILNKAIEYGICLHYAWTHNGVHFAITLQANRLC